MIRVAEQRWQDERENKKYLLPWQIYICLFCYTPPAAGICTHPTYYLVPSKHYIPPLSVNDVSLNALGSKLVCAINWT